MSGEGKGREWREMEDDVMAWGCFYFVSLLGCRLLM